MAEQVLELEETVIEVMMGIEEEGHKSVFARVSKLVDMGEAGVIWMLGRNLYHVAFARHHALVELLELAKLIDQQIPAELRGEWKQCLSIPVMSRTGDSSRPKMYISPHESIYFFGYLACAGLVDISERLSLIEPLYLDVQSVTYRYTMETLYRLFVSCRKAIAEKTPRIYEALRTYLKTNPHLLDEMNEIEKNDIDALAATPLQAFGFDPHVGALISMDAYMHMVISSDDLDTLQKLSTDPGFDVDMRLKDSLVSPTYVLSRDPALIHVAAFYGSVKCFRFLVMNHADLFLRDYSDVEDGIGLVQFAVMGGNIEILKLCVQNGLPLTKAGHTAVEYHRHIVFHWLLENGKCTLTERDGDGLSLMDMAADSNNITIARYLYDNGAVPPLDHVGKSFWPLVQACNFDCVTIVHLICTRHPEITNDQVIKAIKSAISGNSLDVLKYLVVRYRHVVTPSLAVSLIQQAEQAKLAQVKQWLSSLL